MLNIFTAEIYSLISQSVSLVSQGNETEEKTFQQRNLFKEDLKDGTEVDDGQKQVLSR